MVIGISILQHDLERLLVKAELTGLTVGTRYDVFRLQLRSLGKDDTDTRIYERELPDRRGLWSSVAHRVGWEAPTATCKIRDYEALKRPFRYYICASDAGGPHEWDFSDGPYPVSRGVLDDTVIHFNGQLEDASLGEKPDEGHVLIRSTADLARYIEVCVVDIDEIKYTARGTEHSVIGSQFPTFISDSREARRGTMTVLVRNLHQYNVLRSVCFPASGRIWPIVVSASSDPTLLLDDLRCLPLDVDIEQVTATNADYRYVRIDFVEQDPNVPLVRRAGDNDDLAAEPDADFTISDHTPGRGDWVTVTDTSDGVGDDWEWTLNPAPANNPVGAYYTDGPHRVRYWSPGKKHIKLRFGGSGQGYDTVTKTITVG